MRGSLFSSVDTAKKKKFIKIKGGGTSKLMGKLYFTL